jgi:hypothetical protein
MYNIHISMMMGIDNASPCKYISTSNLGLLYIRSQDHESLGLNNSILNLLLDLYKVLLRATLYKELSPGPNNSILNLLLDLRIYLIKIHLSPKRQTWPQKLYGVF